MHVLQIVSGDEVNGAVTYSNFLTERLVNEGYRVTMLHRNNEWLVQQQIPGVQYLASELNRTPSELRRIASWNREHKVDLIHTHMSRAHFFGVLLKTLTGVPTVATAHSCNFQLHWKLNNFVIANSQSTLEYHRRVNWVKKGKSVRSYCFTDLDRFRQVSADRIDETRSRLRAGEHDFLVGVVGQIGTRKGQLQLFRCLPELFRVIPNLKIVLLGYFLRDQPYVRKLRALQMKNRWSGRIKWLGRRDNVEDYLNAFDLCVVPSLREPLGLVALESLASGTPVVATNTGGLPEIVTHEDNGLLVPPRDTQQLTDAIVRMWQNPDVRKQMGLSGRAMVQNTFQPAELTQQVTDVYDRIFAASQDQASRNQLASRKTVAENATRCLVTDTGTKTKS